MITTTYPLKFFFCLSCRELTAIQFVDGFRGFQFTAYHMILKNFLEVEIKRLKCKCRVPHDKPAKNRHGNRLATAILRANYYTVIRNNYTSSLFVSKELELDGEISTSSPAPPRGTRVEISTSLYQDRVKQ
ncbi:unnamed protein product [Amoebophrya sp. A25]|nr:unnamed protein product [Amoebophrya sp. A25]|eukprot:GSA25T00017524001.1